MQDLKKAYQSPQTQLNTTSSTEPNHSTWYHFSGRIGRLRYLTYQTFILFFTCLILFILVFLLGMVGENNFEQNSGKSLLLLILIIIAFIPALIYNIFVYKIRRLNDLNQTGWLVLLSFVPVVNWFLSLYLIFAKGTDGANQYGAQPRENRWYHWLGGLILPIICSLSILLAFIMAPPDYDSYVERTKTVQMKK